MKSLLVTLLVSFAATLPGWTQIEVCMRIVNEGDADTFADPTLPEDLRNRGFFRLNSVSIGARNTVNIGSISSGGGAGKAEFKELTITKHPSKVSTELFRRLVTGSHFEQAEIILYNPSGTPSGKLYDTRVAMKFELRLVMAQDIDYSVSSGDHAPEETVVLQFGAIHLTYFHLDTKGSYTKAGEATWSRVKNEASFEVE